MTTEVISNPHVRTDQIGMSAYEEERMSSTSSSSRIPDQTGDVYEEKRNLGEMYVYEGGAEREKEEAAWLAMVEDGSRWARDTAIARTDKTDWQLFTRDFFLNNCQLTGGDEEGYVFVGHYWQCNFPDPRPVARKIEDLDLVEVERRLVAPGITSVLQGPGFKYWVATHGGVLPMSSRQVPYTLYPIPYTLYPIPYTLYPIPYYDHDHDHDHDHDLYHRVGGIGYRV
jgi:hypothetical protein